MRDRQRQCPLSTVRSVTGEVCGLVQQQSRRKLVSHPVFAVSARVCLCTVRLATAAASGVLAIVGRSCVADRRARLIGGGDCCRQPRTAGVRRASKCPSSSTIVLVVVVDAERIAAHSI